jgi:alpha/beta superfamily hydrolase
MIAETPVSIEVEPGVTLAGRLAVPDGARGGIAVCHPHPLYGGDMDNPVVVRAVEIASAAALTTIRFNFRGVGASSGAHGGGEAEQRDLRAALARLRQTTRGPAIVAGYSFGSLVAADVAAANDVAGVALIAPPVGVGPSRRLPALPPHLPLAIIVGSHDQYCPPDATARLRSELPTAEVTVIDGADHFFLGKLFPLGEALRAWLDRALPR